MRTALVLLFLSSFALADCKSTYDKNNNLDGPTKCFHENGKLQSVTPWKAGKRTGKQLYYTEAGKLESEETYVEDRREGPVKYFSKEHGTLKEEGSYKQEQKHGTWKTYYEEGRDGKVADIREYVDGNEVSGKEFWPNGKPKSVYVYGKNRKIRSESFRENGTPDDSWIEDPKTGITEKKVYYDNGKLRYVEHWKQDQMHGLKVSYHENGTEERRECYQNGSLVEGVSACSGGGGGPETVTEKFPNGKTKEEYRVVGGKKDGEHKIYFENGKLRSLYTYKAGKLDGPVKQMSEEGKLREAALYADGKKHGKETKHFDSGEVQTEIEWKDGRSTKEKTFYQNGKLKREQAARGEFWNRKEYDDRGTLREEYGVILGGGRWGGETRQGSSKIFDEKGRLIEEATYAKGEYEGVVKRYYSETGKPLSKITYKNGRIASRTEYDKGGRVTLSEEYYEDGSRK